MAQNRLAFSTVLTYNIVRKFDTENNKKGGYVCNKNHLPKCAATWDVAVRLFRSISD